MGAARRAAEKIRDLPSGKKSAILLLLPTLAGRYIYETNVKETRKMTYTYTPTGVCSSKIDLEQKAAGGTEYRGKKAVAVQIVHQAAGNVCVIHHFHSER